MPFSIKAGSYRLRFALIASLYSAALLAVLFVTAVSMFRKAELHTSYEVLRPAAQLAMEVYHQRPLDPDWGEITVPTPQISIAVFDSQGQFLDSAGSLQLRPLEGRDLTKFEGIQATYLGRKDSDGHLIVVALPWTTDQRNLNRFTQFLLGLYLFLVLATGVVTWQASRSTFQPLAQLADQAEQLSTTDLSRRLTLEGSNEYTTVAAHLNRFLELLQASVQRQERFVSDAAHELRTPLTVIRGQIETALLRARTPEDYRHTLQVALSEAERLSRLVEGLLLSASAPVTDPQPIDLETALERAHARWLDRFSLAGIELQLLDSPTAVVAIRDEEADSIIDNLLSNALKHSDAGSTTRISLRREGGNAIVTIADEGTGIPDSIRENLFERFTRADTSRNRELGGFGIGLSVVKRITDARSGTVRLAESEVGATFEVGFPLAE